MRFVPRSAPTRPGPRARRRAGKGYPPSLEALEDRALPSATISGFVYGDVNHSGLMDPGEPPIANNPIVLYNAANQVVGRAVTDANGFYAFTTDATIDTTPKVESFSIGFPTNKTNQSQTGTLPQFDPSLGTLTSIDLTISGQITSDIKVENQDPSPAMVNGVISGTLNLAGPGFNTQVATNSSTKTFAASAYDGVDDFAGTSGRDFGAVTVPGASTIHLTGAALAAYLGTGAIPVTETAQATSSANGGGNLLVNITSTGSAALTVTYHYTPANGLRPGNYLIVQAKEPPGFLNGLDSRNGVVLPFNPGPGPDAIPVTLADGDAPNNNFGELFPTADLSITKTASPNPVLVNAPLTYTLVVANAGPVTAMSVTVTDTLPPGVAFVSASGSGWSFSQSGGVVTGTLPSLAPGASTTITLNVTSPPTVGWITNTASVSSSTPDNNPANNQASVNTLVVTPTLLLSADVFPPLPSSFPSPHDMNFLSKISFLAIGGTQNLDPTLLAQATYVDGLYRTLLNRDADMGGLVNFVRYLRSGGGLGQVVQILWNSDEHRGLQVNNFFQAFLHRPADPASLPQWINLFHNGATENSVAQAILSSPEYQAAHPGNTDFITGLYQDLLGRPPDPSATAAWTQALQSGMSRSAVAAAFLNSDEENLKVIDDTYINILHRGADPAGRMAWLNAFHTGQVNGATLAMGFLQSAEFYGMAVQASQT